MNDKKRRTLLQWIKFAGLTAVVGISLPVIGVTGLTSILENAKNPKWISEERYKHVTVDELIQNPQEYQGQLVAIEEGKVWMNQYSRADVNTLLKRMSFETDENYAHRLTINSKLKGKIPTNISCEYISDAHETEYKEVNRILGKNNYNGDIVLKGRIKKIINFKDQKPTALKGITINYQTGKTTQLEAHVIERAKQNDIILKGYSIELDREKFYLGDVR